MADNIIRFTYTGVEIIPREATHIFVDAAFIPARAFLRHPNIVEVICHDGVETIEVEAFYCCPSLRRVIMPGVKIIDGEALSGSAFYGCEALADVECGKLEMIGHSAFGDCTSLTSINLPSAKTVSGSAFTRCIALTNATFSNKLERVNHWAFDECWVLERITIPLKDGLFTDDNTFQGCDNLRQVDLVEAAELHETVAALHLDEWSNDMNEEIDSINQILHTAPPGNDDYDDYGEKTHAIRRWIRSVLGKINHYKAEHQRILDEAATTLQCTLPHEIATNNVLTFLELPAHTFERANQEMEEDHWWGARWCSRVIAQKTQIAY